MEATLGLTRPFSYGRGYPELVCPLKPAAGKTSTFVVPGAFTERLVLAHAQLTASAQVATRSPRLVIADPDGNAVAVFGPSGAVLKEAVQATTYAVDLGYVTTAATGDAQVGISDFLLTTGMQVTLDVASIASEDQLDKVFFYLEKWPNGPDGYPQGVEPTYLPPGLLS